MSGISPNQLLKVEKTFFDAKKQSFKHNNELFFNGIEFFIDMLKGDSDFCKRMIEGVIKEFLGNTPMYSITVSEEYTHKTQLTNFRNSWQNDFNTFDQHILDKNYGQAEIRNLSPGSSYTVHLVPIRENATVFFPYIYQLVYTYYNAFFSGPQGLTLAFDQHADRFPLGSFVSPINWNFFEKLQTIGIEAPVLTNLPGTYNFAIRTLDWQNKQVTNPCYLVLISKK